MKKILPFIIILSLLVSFFPCFNIPLYAADSVSDNTGDGGGHHRGSSYTGLMGYINNKLLENGYVLNEPDRYVAEILIDLGVIKDNTNVESDYDSYIINNNIDVDALSDSVYNSMLSLVEENTPYVLYRVLHPSDFKNMLSSVDAGVASWKSGFVQYCSNLHTDSVYFLQGNTSYYRVDGTSTWGNHHLITYEFDKSIFDNYSIYCTRNNVSQSSFEFNNLFFNNASSSDSGSSYLFSVWFGNYSGTLPSLSVNQTYYYSTHGFLSGNTSNISNTLGQLPLVYYNGGSTMCFNGGFFLCAESVPTFYIMVFKSYTDLYDFYAGNSNFYKFDSSVNIPSNLPDDFNYQRLYDLIGDSLGESTGNIADIINSVSDKYLQQQLDLLHDINNALNDGSGQSWLRRIYCILDLNFPLTLNAFDELIHAVQNISVSGGGDFSEATQVLHEIDTKLGILIDEPFTDLTDHDWDQMKSRVQTKFPFCIFSDIVAISVILNRPPQQPDLNFPIPIIGSESENLVHIDLSPYEHARPYVHGALIFIFIIGLLALSVKIFDHLKS